MPVPPLAHTLAALLAGLPNVRAVALGGSTATGLADPSSDIDLYVYADPIPDADARRALIAPRAVPGECEIDNRWFEPDDEWQDREGEGGGTAVDVMYRDPGFIEGEIVETLERARPKLGYTTTLVHNVATTVALHDPTGWYADLQERARAPYPERLARAIVAHNGPMLRGARASYLEQMRLAALRDDAVSSNHRAAAFLASWFDMLFAANRALHPGEKRLVAHVRRAGLATPDNWEAHVEAFLAARPSERPALAETLAEGMERLVADRSP